MFLAHPVTYIPMYVNRAFSTSNGNILAFRKFLRKERTIGRETSTFQL